MWGNAVWFIIHLTALYAPQPLDQSFESFKQMLNALRFILPCSKCRSHLTQNLQYIDFDHCAKSNEDLFKCSWKLHNIVNKSENKPLMSLQDAFSMYTFWSSLNAYYQGIRDMFWFYLRTVLLVLVYVDLLVNSTTIPHDIITDDKLRDYLHTNLIVVLVLAWVSYYFPVFSTQVLLVIYGLSFDWYHWINTSVWILSL